MKKLIFSFLLLLVATVLSAQEVNHKNKVYKVKGDKIYNQVKDVTETLHTDEKVLIFDQAKKVNNKEKELKAIDKKQKQAEKNQKKAEKKQKLAEKELKKQQQAQKKYLKNERDYTKSVNKYNKLKRKGKLSPVAEVNWLEKIEKQRERLEKAKKKL